MRLGGTLPDGEGASTLGRAPIVYDVDPVVHYLSSLEEWVDLLELPSVEPPPSPGRQVLADFVLPDATAERSEELRREGGMAAAEEWIEGIGDVPQGDIVGCVFSPAYRGGRLERLKRGQPAVAKAWSAMVTLGGWEPDADGGKVLREKQSYDWLIGLTREGRFSGAFDLEVVGRMAGAGREQELWEHYGLTLLYPFLFSFAMLACENVDAVVVSEGDFDGDPRYLRPAVRGVSVGGKDVPAGGSEAQVTITGHISRLQAENGSPPEMSERYYWVPD